MGIFRMPSLGADMEAGTLVEWLIQPGDTVHRGDVVAAVETQKGAIEIEIFEEGTVVRLEASLGQELPVGAPLAVIQGAGETAAPEVAPTPENEPVISPAPPAADLSVPTEAAVPEQDLRPAEIPVASPAARARARELGVDLASITGSGPGGVIVLTDVDRPVAAARSDAEPAAASPRQEMRKAIAAAMTRSKQTIPHVYLSHTIDIQRSVDWLKTRNDGTGPEERILLGALFVRAATLAAAKTTELNGHYLKDSFHASEQVNPGIAVALRGGGLVAPALMDAAGMTLAETMAGMRDLVTRARAGRLRSTEMTEGTITISMLGESGPEMMTGVIFPPQVALVCIGAPQTRPWVVDGTVVPRTVVTICVSADHRVADGRQVARYITAFETILQSQEGP